MKTQQFVLPLLFLVVLGLMFSLPSCDDSKTPTGESIIFPAPSDPSPVNYAEDQNTLVNLSWSDCSIEGTTVEYLVALGTDVESVHYIAVTNYNSFTPPPLEPNTKYYWRIEARGDNDLVRKSPVWSFTTGSSWVYPLVSGAEWRYEYHMEYEDFQPESLGYVLDQPPPDTLSVYIIGWDIAENGDEVWALHQHSWFYNETSTSYFDNRPDGLYYLGTTGYGTEAIPHKPVAGTGSKIAPEMPHSTACLIDLLAASSAASAPQRSLAYPLKRGARWTVIDAEDSEAGWTIAKEVFSYRPVPTDYGYIEGHEIRRFWDKDGDGSWDDDIDWVDYVGQQGLLARGALYYNIAVVDYTSGDPEIVGTVTIRERLKLIYTNLIGEVY